MISSSDVKIPELIVALDGKTIVESTDIIAELDRIQEETKDRLDIIIKFNDLLPTVSYEELAKIMAQHPNLAVFLDPKWHDIAPTNQNHMKRLTESGMIHYVRYLTMHPESFANPGDYQKMIAPLLAHYPQLKTLAITFLTTLGNREARLTHGKPAKGVVLDNAHLALSQGFSGTVSSAEEAAMLREVFGNRFGDFPIVTPGIRFAGNDAGSQKRVMTPEQARKNGSTAQVMGTDILRNPTLNVHDAILRFLQETEGVVHIHTPTAGVDTRLEELVRMGTIQEILDYIGATYERPDSFAEGYGYVRWNSGLVTSKYTNLAVLERHSQVLERVSRDMADRLEAQGIVPQLIIGAAMGSVRLSDRLGQMFGVSSIYAEKAKDGKTMEFNRHDIPDYPVEVVVCEDTISAGGTVTKILEALKGYPNVTVRAVSSVGRNTVAEVDFGVPFISLVDIPTPKEVFTEGFPFHTRPVGSGKKYVLALQKLVREGKGSAPEDFEGIVSQK